MADLFTDTLADLNTALKALRQPTAHLGFVSSGAILMDAKAAANKFLNFRKRHVARSRIVAPRLILPNFYMSSFDETGTGSAATVKGAIEQNGVTVAATFSAAASGTSPDTGYIVSDPMDTVDIAAGTPFFVRGYCNFPSGMPYSTGKQNPGAGECFEYGASALTDRTSSIGTFSSTDASNIYCDLGPVANTLDPSLFFNGDSTFVGTGGALDDDGADFGLPKALAQFFGSLNAGVSSQTSTGFAGAVKTNRIALANAYATHLIMGHGLNQLGNSLAQNKIDLAAEKALFSSSLIACMTTTPPRGTTSDSGVTVANQTPGANETTRTGLNDWRRLGVEGFGPCIEIADLIEVNSSGVKTRNGGRYPANMSADMVHPTSAGYQLVKATAASLRATLGR